ncbi:hypothetical protein OIU78_004682 [Salix suchowensis]|nr:hypothetical protein OIU78_004682 [Salix suchowensis]
MESMKDSSVISSNDKDDASTAKVEEKCSTRMPTYPPLPEEPSGDKSLLCRVGIRLPDGRRVQRNFLKTAAMVILLFSTRKRRDKAVSLLTEAIPGAKRLDYDSTMTFGGLGAGQLHDLGCLGVKSKLQQLGLLLS